MLIVEGLVGLVALYSPSPYADSVYPICINLSFLAAGVLFLASWWTARELRDKKVDTTTFDRGCPTLTAPDQTLPGINRSALDNKDDINEKGPFANTPRGQVHR